MFRDEFLAKKMILCNFLLIRFVHYKLCTKIYLCRFFRAFRRSKLHAVIDCLFLYKHTNDDFLRQFSEHFRTFFKDFRGHSKSCPKARRSFPKIFRKCQKISGDNRRFLRKNRCCFDHEGTHLSTFQGIM